MSGTDIEQAKQSHSLAPKTTYSAYERFFLKHKNKKFAQDAEIAFRAATAVLILATPFVLPKDLLRETPGFGHVIIELMDVGWYNKYVAACFLFSFYKDLGNTINLAVTTVFGVWMAVFSIWMLFGVYPEGIQHDSPTWLYTVCFAYGGVFAWMMVWLNLPMNSIIFSVASFVWYYMAFMNPNVVEKKFATGFEIDLTGTATKELLNATMGSLLAVLTMCIPYPVLSSRVALQDSSGILDVLMGSWRDLTAFACAQTVEEMSEFREARIKRGLRDICSSVGSLQANLDVAWWECFGMGTIQKRRAMLYSLAYFLNDSYDRILAVFSVFLSEKNPSPLTQHVRPQIEAIINECEMLLGDGLSIVQDAHVDPDESQRMLDRCARVKQAVKNLAVTFREQRQASSRPPPAPLDPDLFGEHAFCLTVSAFGTGCAEWGEGLANNRFSNPESGGFMGIGGIKSFFDEATLFRNRDHLMWAIRNWISLCFGFYIGYIGEIKATKFATLRFTSPYNAAIASTLAVLLSKGLSTGVTKNLSRLQGVILGTAIGVKIYSIFAMDCSWLGMGAMMISIFLWMNFTFFLYHNSDVNSYLAFLLGYAGTMNMVAPCGWKGNISVGGIVMDLLMTIVIMTVMDMLFAKDTAAHMAQNAFKTAWGAIKNSLRELMDPDFKDIAFREQEILGLLSTAAAMGALAEQEARWQRVPWRAKTYQAAMASATRIRYLLTGMKTAAAGGNKPKPKPETLLLLSSVDGWKDVAERPQVRMQQVEDLLVILDHETEDPCVKYQKAEEEVSAGGRSFPHKVKKVAEHASKHEVLRKTYEVDSLEEDPASRQSYLLAACAALIEETRQMASNIVYEG